jgi:hypothetical protein
VTTDDSELTIEATGDTWRVSNRDTPSFWSHFAGHAIGDGLEFPYSVHDARMHATLFAAHAMRSLAARRPIVRAPTRHGSLPGCSIDSLK